MGIERKKHNGQQNAPRAMEDIPATLAYGHAGLQVRSSAEIRGGASRRRAAHRADAPVDADAGIVSDRMS